MEKPNKPSRKSRITLTLPKETIARLKKRAKGNFRDVSGEADCNFSTIEKLEEEKGATEGD